MIDSLDVENYDFIPLETEKGYRSKIRQMKVDED